MAIIKREDMCCSLTLNPDKEVRTLAIAGVRSRGGYCPCKVARIPVNRCICENTKKTGICECGLYVRVPDVV